MGKKEPKHLHTWDLAYYLNKIKQIDYAVDHEEIKKYFPVTVVKAGVLRLYQSLLGLKFERIQTDNVWHPDVEMYSVKDEDTDVLLGYFYLDLHPREGKFGHAAVFPLQPGCLRKKDVWTIERQVAIAAMVANFTGPTKAQPDAYLMHSEVKTFFHEFGHLMHNICAKACTQRFSGTNVETDFVECPSQMLENWVWTKEGIEALTSSSNKKMPEHLLQKLLKSQFVGVGAQKVGQLVLAMYDQAIHTDKWEDEPEEIFKEIFHTLTGIKIAPTICKSAGFRHVAEGYDACYYGYLWSEIFSADLFETRFRHASDGGCLSRKVGREYRRKILQPGGTKDAADMLRDFLGREPSDDAFFSRIS